MSSKATTRSDWFDSKNDSRWSDSSRDGLVQLQIAGAAGKAYSRTTRVVQPQGSQYLERWQEERMNNWQFDSRKEA